MNLNEAVISRTRRLPLPAPVAGDGAAASRQLDAALVSAGFKLSRDLLCDLAGRDAGQVLDIGVAALRAARTMAGDHVQHNPYFIDFPRNVPDTLEFWASLLEQALLAGVVPGSGAMVDIGGGELVQAGSLLSLPGYGTVPHSYEDMLAAHEALAASAGDRVTILHPGQSPAAEADALYLELAGSRVPLAGEDLVLLGALVSACGDRVRPEQVPVRENRAVINQAALASGQPLLADTVTDVLRLAAVLSGGDVTLEEPTRFRSLSRAERRALLKSLDGVVGQAPAKLADVGRHAEPWKRLGERLHPHEFGQFPQALRVFAVARGEEPAPSLASRAERAFRTGDSGQAARVLSVAPGLFLRSLDRLLRAAPPGEAGEVLSRAEQAMTAASGRVLLSVREHFQNRGAGPGALPRIYANRKGTAWVAPDARAGIDPKVRPELLALLDEAIAARLPAGGRVIVDPDVLGVALPLSGKAAAPGLGVMPRGSVSTVAPGEADVLSFFTHWRQRELRTDYDLSALLVDREFTRSEFVSWQAYQSADAAVTYSGDITSALEGATEFISCDLRRMSQPVVIPQVYLYSGEAFDQAAEAFFGYMMRGSEQRGAPFEAATVRMKSDLRGSGRIALPLAFLRGEDGKWRVKWLHLYLKGRAAMNVVQDNKLSTSLLTRTVIERNYLRVGYLVKLMESGPAGPEVIRAGSAPEVALAAAGAAGPVTYIGLERPEGLPDDASVITLDNLAGLIPA